MRKEKKEKKEKKIRKIEELGLTYPKRTDVLKTTVLTAGIMLFGGAFIFIIDTATMYFFAVMG